MKVLIIGSGGREHALAWKVAQNSNVTQVFVAPGNAGTALEAKVTNIDMSVDDIDPLVQFAKKESIDLTIVGPEIPLVLGVVDAFEVEDLAIFGPNKAAAQLEGSKAFAKDFLLRHQIPTAAYATFTDMDKALTYVQEQGAPIVIKADGLAAGKGVIVAMTLTEAMEAIKDMLADNSFGEAGSRVVIEEFLEGEEASFIVMADGIHALAMATSQDHKRVGNKDTGPNTGGMGAYSPAPVVTPEIHQRVMDEIILPTINGMSKDGMPYTGFLYAGLMIDHTGAPKVIEYNCRFGDPETQPIMMRLQSDLVELCFAALEQKLDKVQSQWDPRPAVGVVMAANGYPSNFRKADVIYGLTNLMANDKTQKIFHAGTKQEGDNTVTNGGRVLCAAALGRNVTKAQQNAYQLVQQVHWEGCFYRNDIGHRAIAREQSLDTIGQ